MVENADGLVAFAHYPHDDTFSTGERGATLLLKIVRHEVTPRMALAKVPVLSSGVRGMTFGDAPMAHLTRRARELEKEPGILSVSIFHVQPSNDLAGMGSGGLVITDGDLERATREARSLAEEYWARRREFEPVILSIDEAIRRGREVAGGPVLLVDTSDCVGGGAAGDSVALLKRLLDLGVNESSLFMVVDPEAAQLCAQAGIGKELSLSLGYKIDPSWGQPFQVKGVIRHLLDGDFIYTGGAYGGTKAQMGLSAVLGIGNIRVLIMSKPTYDWADEQFRCAGLDVRFAKFIGVKNPMNYNFAYQGIAKASFVVDTPGPTPATMRHLPYRRMQRPFFPIDEEIPGLQPTIFTSLQPRKE
jgi:microcystin degradation protein MlrC